MANYDPNTAPDAVQWLSLDEGERMRSVEAAHRKLSLGDPKRDRLHAIVHLVVENQLAGNNPAAVAATVERFRAAGVSRHEAVHAVGSVMAQFMFGAMSKEESFDESRYVVQLAGLDPVAWRAQTAKAGR